MITSPEQRSTTKPTASELAPEIDATLASGPAPTVDQHRGDLRSFGDYDLLDEVARGGMGVVYRARQVSLNRVVALKMILAGQFAGEQDVQRFRAEAAAAANLDHPHIVPVYEVGELEGQHYFSMGFVNGESLADRVSEGPLPPMEAAAVVRVVAEAMAYAHSKGVIHRDLKPANILLAEPDGAHSATSQVKHGSQGGGTAGSSTLHGLLPYVPKVTDFGLAKQVSDDQGMTATGQILGTPAYMPPEQAAGQVDEVTETADVYSLGAILYCLIVGRPPFQAANPLDTLMQVMRQEPAPPRQLNPSVARDLETIALKCLQKDPAKRYQRAEELAAELSRFLSGHPIQARPIGGFEKAWRWCRRNPAVASLMSVIAGVLVIATFVSTVFAVSAVLSLWRAERAAEEANVARKRQAEAEAVARQERDYALRRLVVTDMRLANEAADRGEFGSVERILMSHIPKPNVPDLRGWEWYYQLSRSRSRMRKLVGHTSIVEDFVFSADGKQLMSLGGSRALHIWNTDIAEIEGINGKITGLRAIAWRPDRKNLATGHADGSIKIWTSDQQPVATLKSSDARILDLHYDSSGERIVVLQADATLRVWRVKERQILKEIAIDKWPQRFAIHPSKALLAIRRAYKGLALYDIDSGELQHEANMSDAGPISIAFSPDERWVACGLGFEENPVVVFELDDDGLPRGRRHVLEGHFQETVSLDWSADSTTLASASADGSVRLWRQGEDGWETRQVLDGHASQLTHVSFSPSGEVIAAGSRDRTISLWRLGQSRAGATWATAPDDRPRRIHWSPSGTHFATASRRGMRIWNAETMSLESTLDDVNVGAVDWTNDNAIFGVEMASQRALRWNGDKLTDSPLVMAKNADVVGDWRDVACSRTGDIWLPGAEANCLFATLSAGSCCAP